MVVCIIVFFILLAGMIVFGKREKWKKVRNPCLILLLFCVLAIFTARKEQQDAIKLLEIGFLAAAVSIYVQKEQIEKKEKKRKERLLLEYPEFVSKLSLLLGSGMTILSAFQKMNQMYRKQENKKKDSPVYDELYRMLCEVENGMGEFRAYQRFGERCSLQPYRKLTSLLLSSQQMGNRKLTERLNEEADRVFQERKNMARKLGEEAATKMLFPMMMMLAVVMGIVMVPAFLSINLIN